RIARGGVWLPQTVTRVRSPRHTRRVGKFVWQSSSAWARRCTNLPTRKPRAQRLCPPYVSETLSSNWHLQRKSRNLGIHGIAVYNELRQQRISAFAQACTEIERAACVGRHRGLPGRNHMPLLVSEDVTAFGRRALDHFG